MSTATALLMTCLACSLAAQSLAAQAVPPRPPQGQGQQLTPMIVPQAVALPRGDTEIRIDGTHEDWPGLPGIMLNDGRQLSGTQWKAWNGERDCAALAFTMWDEHHLYFAATVKDEWHRALDANSLQLSEVPLADSIILTFDPERDTRASGPHEGRREDREFWLADEIGRKAVLWDRLRGTARTLDGDAARVVVLHDKVEGLTTYEAKLPWHEVLPGGGKPAPGLVIDLEIVVNDFDEATDPMPQTRIGWTFGCGPVIDPGLLGSLMLVGDRAALEGRVPEFPPKPPTSRTPLGSAEEWHELSARLVRAPPALHDGSQAPEQAGGLERLKVLEAIEAHTARYPRVDYVEYHHRIHRRMQREVAGIRARGLPFWWATRLEALSKAAEDPVPNNTARIFRIPTGGWLVGTSGGGFAIDAAGADVTEWLWGRMEFVVLTQPLDMTRRNDQLVLRMLMARPARPVLTHIAFHLPVVAMRDMPLVVPGTSCGPPKGGLEIKALGRKHTDGSVAGACSYHIGLGAGPRVLVVAPALSVTDLDDSPVDVMILSPRNPEALKIVEKVKPGLILIDDTFLCQAVPGVARMRLRDLHSFQKALAPNRSVLLAPGEAWDVTRSK